MRALALLLPAALLAGCADNGPFPSLAQRPIERELPPPDVEPAAADVPDDPAIAARIADFRMIFFALLTQDALPFRLEMRRFV